MGNVEVLKYIIDTKIKPLYKDINEFNNEIGKGIYDTKYNPNSGIIDCLLDYGANIHVTNTARSVLSNILNQTIFTENINTIKRVLNLGGKLDCNSMSVGVGTNDLNIIKLLVEQCNGPLNDRNHMGENIILDIATTHNNLELVKYLLDNGAIITKDDNVLLYNAIENTNLDMVKLLIKHGASAKDEHDEIIKFASYKKRKDIILYLLLHGASITAIAKQKIFDSLREEFDENY